MKELQIPPQYQLGITLIIKIDDNLFNKLLDAIKSCHPFLKLETIELEIEKKVEELPINELKEIIKAISSIYSLHYHENLETIEITQGLRNALLMDETFSSLSSGELERFEQRLTQLLSVDASISLSSKARVLIQEYERLLIKSRIVTDIRPIFKSDKKEGLAGALIVHTLKIEYYDSDGIKEFYVALDSQDVKKLQENLSEALVESDIIQDKLKQSDVLYLDPYV